LGTVAVVTRAPILGGTRRVGGVSFARRTSMRVLFSAIALSAALVATDASAQVNLTGRYRCVELCQGPGGYAYITQNGWEMNIVNDVGEASRAWLDYPGRIWVDRANQGAVFSPDGMRVQFDRGTVWERAPDLPPPLPRRYRR
jgi:hypothetical protein